jgi:hypothetical protein
VTQEQPNPCIGQDRYLVPFMLAIVCLEQVLRIAAGRLKLIEVAAPPLGQIGAYIILPLSLITLVPSLRQTSREA